MTAGKILVLGGSGFIGAVLMRYFNSRGTSRNISNKYERLNLLAPQEVDEFLNDSDESIIINSTGMTNLEECETRPEEAMKVNGNAVSHLAKACHKNDKILVHISTDGIFDGINPPFGEDSFANPINVYGKSKLIGEKEALKYNALVVRISTPFGDCSGYGKVPFNCFVLENVSKGIKIRIAIDQVTTPTYAPDIPAAIDILLHKGKRGIFNLGSTAPISRYDLAIKFVNSAGLDPSLIEPINLADLPFRAKRPLNTSLDSSKISEFFKITPLDNAIQRVAQKFKI